MNKRKGEWTLAAFVLLGVSNTVVAEDEKAETVAETRPRYLFASAGGWAYKLTGSVVNGSQLDFDRDLNLKVSNRSNFALGYLPARLGWVPGLTLDYVRVEASGQQKFAGTAVFGGVQITNGSTVNDSARIDDLELSARWPYRFDDFTFSAGLTATRLNGPVTVALANSAQQDRREISQVFPLPSLAIQWQPAEAFRVTARGDYIRYSGDSAETYELSVLWKILGPVGLEGGYRHRRYKVVDGSYVLDAKLNGARFGLRYEFPF